MALSSSLWLPNSFFLNRRNPSCRPLASSSKPQSYEKIEIASPPPIRTGVAILPVLSFEGQKIGETFLNLRIARPETARSVVHRGIVTFLRNKRKGTACTKGRGDVRGGGRKPYPQKGTGQARRGSQRTPLRRGGAVVFGPKPRDWTIKMNKKERRLALGTALWSAAPDSIVLENFEHMFKRPKTKDFLAAMENWGLHPRKKSMFFLMKASRNLVLSCRNISTLRLLKPTTFNLFDILNSDKLVYTQASVDYLNKMYASKRKFRHWRRWVVEGEDDRTVIQDNVEANVLNGGDQYEVEGDEAEGDEDVVEGDECENEEEDAEDCDEDGDSEEDYDEEGGNEDYDEEGDNEDYDDDEESDGYTTRN